MKTDFLELSYEKINVILIKCISNKDYNTSQIEVDFLLL